MKARINYINGNTEYIDLLITNNNNIIKATLPALDYTEIQSIDFAYDYFNAAADDDGYLVMIYDKSALKYSFKEHEDITYEAACPFLPIYGAVKNNNCFWGLVTGYFYEYSLVSEIKNNTYSIYPKFDISGRVPYEEISVEYRNIPNGTYSDIGCAYREYLLNKKQITPIKNRKNKYLDYAEKSVYVRIRQAWKPVPPVILEQTPNNEPPLHVAVDFKGVRKLIDEFKRQGIDKAEFCLVGWNIGGHDGRWPQAFPVDETLGGESELRKTIAYAKENGYMISCHTNSTDAYSIADCWSDDLLEYDKDKKPISWGEWSGGKMYNVCSEKGYELAEKILPKVRELGFSGLHYIDVIGVSFPRQCHNPKHPLNKKEFAQYWIKTAQLSKKLFGGFSSEGGTFHIANVLDYALYNTMTESDKMPIPDADANLPLWQIVYHGTVLYNPFISTVNYPLKPINEKLKLIEYGGRPSIYYYSRFMSNNNDWMAKKNQDFLCSDEKSLKYGVSKIKQAYDEYKEMAYLQEEFITNHQELKPQLFEITYSDGSVVTVDYNTNEYNLIKPPREK